MSPLVEWLSTELIRATLWLALAGVTAALVLRVARVTSPALHRVACCATLLVGCFLVRPSIDIPWYLAEPVQQVDFAPSPTMESTELAPSGAMQAAAEVETLPPVVEPAPIEFAAPIVSAPLATLPADRPAHRLPTWQEVALVVWIAGIAAFLVFWIAGYLWFVFRLPASIPSEGAWHDEWQSVLAGQGRGAGIALRVTGNLGPLLCRLPGGYALLVPEALWRKLSGAERQAILRHELAHWQRGDVWKSLAVRLLALVHWFNPVTWWAVRRFDEAAEWACDRAASAGEPTTYARILMHLSELAAPRARFGSAMRARPLAARIRRLVTLEQQEDPAMKKILILTAAACLVGVSLVRVQLVAQEPVPGSEAQAPSAVKPPGQPRLPPPSTATTPEPGTDLLRSRAPTSTRDLREAQRKAVESAKQAYEVALPKYASQNTTLDTVYVWSSRWLAAALGAAGSHDERMQAARDHRSRMRLLQKQVQAGYQAGIKDSLEINAANFYVAEAERKLAELKAQPIAPQALPATDGAAPQTAPPRAAAPKAVRPVPIPNAVPQPVAPAPAPAQASPAEERAPPTTSPLAPESGPQNPYDPKTSLRYDGKTFDEWRAVLRSDLSPTRRAEAVTAISTFGANGQGPQAAAAIIDAMKGYSVYTLDASPEGQLKSAALGAFQPEFPPKASVIPPKDSVPLLTEALKSDNAHQRLFAVAVLPKLVSPTRDAVKLLTPMLEDPNDEVRRYAASQVRKLAPATPQVWDVVVEALAASDPTLVEWAFSMMRDPRYFPGTLRDEEQKRAFASPLVRLLAHETLGSDAFHFLLNIGRPAIPPLEEGLKSLDSRIRERAEELLKRLRTEADSAKSEELK